MVSRIVSCILITLFLGTAIAAEPQQSDKSKYETLLEKAKKGDAINFRELRMAYANSRYYSPYGGDTVTGKAMLAALNESKYLETLELAAKILQKNYVDIDAHMVTSTAYEKMKNSEWAKYHRSIVDELIRSVLDSGNGNSAETAFVVISTREEYIILDVLGLKPRSQSLVNEKGHRFDRFIAVDPSTNKTVTLYFNIDRPVHWLDKTLQK